MSTAIRSSVIREEARSRRPIPSYNWTSCRLLSQARSVVRSEPSPTPEASDHLRGVLDTLPCLLWTASPEGQVDFVNRRWCDYTGVSFAESCARWTEAIHVEDLPALVEEWGRVLLSGEPGKVEARLRRHDGEYRRFLITASPLRDAAGRIVKWYGVNSDIEDQARAEGLLRADIETRKRAEALLADENRLLEMIARGSSLAAVLGALCELVERSIGGCHCSVLLVDATSRFRHGAAPSLPASYNEFIDGKPVEAEAGPCAIATLLKMQVIAADLAADSRWSGEWRDLALAAGLRSCWSTPILSRDLKVLGTFAIYQDEPATPTAFELDLIRQFTQVASIAIERARSEAALKQSEAFLAKAQALSSAGSFSWRVGAAELTWSQELYRLFGFDPSLPVTLEQIAARIHPDDIPSFQENLRLAAGNFEYERDFGYELRLLMPDGSIKHLHLVAHGTRDEEGQTVIIGAAQNITERRLSEQALDKVRLELARVARVTSLGALTASIAHEVNQPLSGVVTNASTCLRMLGAEPPNVEGALETVRRTIRDGNRAADVIKRLRALFGKQETSTESVNLNEAAREVIAMLAGELQRRRIILNVELEARLPLIIGDRVQLQQVILNLLLNAMDALNGIDGRPRNLRIRTEREGGDCVRFDVRDAGVGFGHEDPEKLFEAFYTTKDGGMGIGLSVSRSIIERHHGRLSAESNQGPGATFSFSIPLAPHDVKEFPSANEPQPIVRNL
jgi:PAS domain S-box-containing protein